MGIKSYQRKEQQDMQCPVKIMYTDSHKYVSRSSRLLQMSKRATTRKKQLEEEDPLLIKITEESNLDLEYLEMLNAMINDIKTMTLLH